MGRGTLLLRAWAVARLPLFLGLVYLAWPDEFMWLVTMSAIHLVGSLPERLVFFGLLAGLLSGAAWAGRRLSPPWPYLGPVLAALGLFLGLFYSLPGLNPVVMALVLAGVMAANIVPEAALARFMSGGAGRRLANLGFGLVILSGLFLFKPFVVWLGLGRRLDRRLLNWLPVAVVAPGLAVLFLNAGSLAALHRSLFPDPAVHRFARGNFNWLELDLEQRSLYVSGFGTNYIQVYDLEALDRPPRLSPVETGYAEGFAYNRRDDELYVYNQAAEALLVLDAASLELKSSIPMPQVSPGDAWLAWDEASDSIMVASEADEQSGYPTVIIDRTSGQVLDTLEVEPGSLLHHPTRPWIYLSFFRRSSQLLVYDAQAGQVIRTAPAPARLDRMVFVTYEGEPELFVPSPVEGLVLRFDAETLERKGSLDTLFGARAIAVDARRGWLLSGSLVTHRLELIDLASRRRLATYYLGPWQRTISLDVEEGLAYVSTHGGLFTVRYAPGP